MIQTTFSHLDHFGYSIVDRLAHLVLVSSAQRCRSSLAARFRARTKGSLCYREVHNLLVCSANPGHGRRGVCQALASNDRVYGVRHEQWARAGPWYHAQQLERQILGFAASVFLGRVADPIILVEMVRDLFATWAQKRLTAGEDNLAGLCGFLADDTGKPLRLDGLRWIAEALDADPQTGMWFRDQTSNAYMQFLNVLVSDHEADIVSDNTARKALLRLSAHAASRQLTRLAGTA